MASYFLDSSALVKRYAADEIGYQWITGLCEPSAGHRIVIAQPTLVEVVAALCRMPRATPPRLNDTRRDLLIALFRHDAHQQYSLVLVNTDTFTRAADLCRVHPLRAYDALQLACALVIRDEAVVAGVPAPIFVCADDALLAVAVAERLAVENPHAHP
jgi:uncharacterized protein